MGGPNTWCREAVRSRGSEGCGHKYTRTTGQHRARPTKVNDPEGSTGVTFLHFYYIFVFSIGGSGIRLIFTIQLRHPRHPHIHIYPLALASYRSIDILLRGIQISGVEVLLRCTIRSRVYIILLVNCLSAVLSGVESFIAH